MNNIYIIYFLLYINMNDLLFEKDSGIGYAVFI